MGRKKGWRRHAPEVGAQFGLIENRPPGRAGRAQGPSNQAAIIFRYSEAGRPLQVAPWPSAGRRNGPNGTRLGRAPPLRVPAGGAVLMKTNRTWSGRSRAQGPTRRQGVGPTAPRARWAFQRPEVAGGRGHRRRRQTKSQDGSGAFGAAKFEYQIGAPSRPREGVLASPPPFVYVIQFNSGRRRGRQLVARCLRGPVRAGPGPAGDVIGRETVPRGATFGPPLLGDCLERPPAPSSPRVSADPAL